MYSQTNLRFFTVLVSVAFLGCSSAVTTLPKEKNSLKDAFKSDFLVGTSMSSQNIFEQNTKAAQLIKGQFNAITPENVMKAVVIHPEKNTYDFVASDKFVEYGQKNNMHVIGHNLIWYTRLPKFVEQINQSDTLQKFMTDHINTIVKRYAGKVNTWDVVNEALEEDGTLRKSIYQKLLGDDYIVDAFKLVAKADPKAELYYNDYNIELPAKRKGAIDIIKNIQSKGGKIDGVGIQGHWQLNYPSLFDIEQSIVEFAALGVKVAITELDITVLPNTWDLTADVNKSYANSPGANPYTSGLPDPIQKQLATRYENLFKIFLKHKDKISRVTFWGVTDGDSWLNQYPIKDRTNYPLLFDRNYQPKPAYDAVMKLKD
jgi:endo-1,4-beta-xylanase